MTKQSLLLCSIIIMALTACGKAPREEADTDPSRVVDREELNVFIKEQQVFCEDNFNCPEFVAKLVIVDDESIRYCTGTLVAPDKIITASSCLPSRLKVPHTDCRDRIFAFFPQTAQRPVAYSSCSQILSADLNADTDRALWRNDFAVIKLKTEVPRLVADFSKAEIQDQQNIDVWSVQYETDTRSQLVKKSCRPVFNSFFNPFAKSSNSPFIPMADCSFVDGHFGAVGVDTNGKILTIMSEVVEEDIIQYFRNNRLLVGEVAPMVHAANLKCANLGPALSSHKLPDDCLMPLTPSGLDQLRGGLKKNVPRTMESLTRLEQNINRNAKYFKWSVATVEDTDKAAPRVYLGRPYCYMKLDNWVWNFSRRGRLYTSAIYQEKMKAYDVQILFDSYLRPVYSLVEGGDMTYDISFSPADLWKKKTDMIKLSFELSGGQTIDHDYEVNRECPAGSYLSSH